MDPLLAIGVFSRLSAISVRMLRHYQGFGILEPARVDPFTGHRFYRPEQLVTAHWVVRLRDAGLPVSEIGRVLAATDDPGLLRRLLSEHHARLDADRLTLERREEAFRHLTTYLEAATMTIDVRIETLPALTVATLRRVLPDYGSEGLLWQEIG
ncbi:MAG TPA: MerR family transcriptional regulator, partial [Propioniciclava sp.]|uniref:MerR family transcriptional regulator n=1 Tax=Propioniciclava sp. TaxID=2038686 RepID=UPI002CF1DB3F